MKKSYRNSCKKDGECNKELGLACLVKNYSIEGICNCAKSFEYFNGSLCGKRILNKNYGGLIRI